MENILEVKNVSKTYTGHKALDDISLDVPQGKVYGLLGPNGAGKTTLIRIINHITAPDSGEVIFDGHPLVESDVRNIGYLPEERGLYKKMKVGEQALFFARLKGLSKADATRALKEWFDKLEISSWWDKKIEELSKGMAQKVQFIITVLHRPRLLIFDEPFSGFDPINANILKKEILELRDQGATVIFSTHNMSSVEELCDNITLINKSRNILTGNVRDIRTRFSNHRYELAFEGNQQKLIADITPMVTVIEPLGTDRDGLNRVRFALRDASDVRLVLGTANADADIRAFNALLPSMDEVFIRAVESCNEPAVIPPAL
ncbi:MAG: ATP-binding cassette domain-containing protein [Muribaculaceae bacterium]|nr:ATP-binding cassette domain-containing protein [Muribaculaceae bacterium]